VGAILIRRTKDHMRKSLQSRGSNANEKSLQTVDRGLMRKSRQSRRSRLMIKIRQSLRLSANEKSLQSRRLSANELVMAATAIRESWYPEGSKPFCLRYKRSLSETSSFQARIPSYKMNSKAMASFRAPQEPNSNALRRAILGMNSLQRDKNMTRHHLDFQQFSYDPQLNFLAHCLLSRGSQR
jgi:hypothetical protein